MAVYDYELGATAETMANVEDEITVGEGEAATIVYLPPPRSAPIEYPVVYTGDDGLTVGDGLPTCTWRWDFLKQTHVNALRQYCSGKSAQVYIKTRTPALDGTYAVYAAIMHWPADLAEKRRMGGYFDIEIEFTRLEAVT